MTIKLQQLIADGDYRVGLLTRIVDSWKVLFGLACAVDMPPLEELGESLEKTGVMVVREPGDVLQCAHRLGLHQVMIGDCDDCFEDNFVKFTEVCCSCLDETDRSNLEGEFVDWIDSIKPLCKQSLLLFRENPAYFIAGFLKMDYSSPEFEALLETADKILNTNDEYSNWN